MGRAHDEVEVADGHALNYLIPHKFAVAATAVARKAANLKRDQSGARKEIDAHLFKQNIASLEGVRVVIKAKANDQGHLYNGVGKSEIALAVKEAARIDLPEECIALEKPLKELGTFTISASHGDAKGEFSLVIEAE